MSRVDIWVLGFEPGWPEPPSEGLRRVFGMEVQEALTLELTVPAPVKRVAAPEADMWLRALRSIGAEVESRPAEAGLPPAFDLERPQGGAVPEPLGGAKGPERAVQVFEGPPGLVMPSETSKAKAKAKAEAAALAGATKKAKAPPGPPPAPRSGVVKEEVMRVIRTPSVPQDRRPPPARKASQPALLLDEDEDAMFAEDPQPPADDPFGGELDIAPPPKRVPNAPKSVPAFEMPPDRGPRSNPAEVAVGGVFDEATAGNDVELELEDVPRPRVERVDRPARDSGTAPASRSALPIVEGASKGRAIAIGVGILVLGLGALYVGVMRFESCLLGTGSYLTWVLDALGFGAILYGAGFAALTLAGREPELDPARFGGAALLGFGLAFGIATLRSPGREDLSALTSGNRQAEDARQFVSEPKARLAGSSPEEGRQIVDAAFEGGAVSVEAAQIETFLGRKVAHVLVIGLPTSGGARAHMAALIRRALGPERATLASNVPAGSVWAVRLRP